MISILIRYCEVALVLVDLLFPAVTKVRAFDSIRQKLFFLETKEARKEQSRLRANAVVSLLTDEDRDTMGMKHLKLPLLVTPVQQQQQQQQQQRSVSSRQSTSRDNNSNNSNNNKISFTNVIESSAAGTKIKPWKTEVKISSLALSRSLRGRGRSGRESEAEKEMSLLRNQVSTFFYSAGISSVLTKC